MGYVHTINVVHHIPFALLFAPIFWNTSTNRTLPFLDLKSIKKVMGLKNEQRSTVIIVMTKNYRGNVPDVFL